MCLPVILCVSENVLISPEQVDFGRFTKGESVKKSLKVKTLAGTRIKTIFANPKVLDITVGSADDEGFVNVSLSVGKEVDYGRLEGEIRLEFEGDKKGTLTLPFSGYVVADESR